MREALFFWAAAQGAGLAFSPISFLLWRRLPDKGYALAKPLGVLATAYLVWIWGTTGLVPNGRGAALLALLALGSVGLAVALARRREWQGWWRRWWPYVLLVEALFLAVYVVAVFLRSFVPEIVWGEKPFELAFLNSVLRTDTFPPPDPWLAGHSINYYYFGYVQAGALTFLSGLPASTTFYLMLCLTAALSAVATFGLVYDLVYAVRGGEGWWAPTAGVVAVGLLLVVGNLEGVFELLARHGLGNHSFYAWAGIYGLEGPYNCTFQPEACRAWYPTAFWWWWKATRMGSPWDVQEFPFFSFQFGDLHPHVLALPLALATVALAWELFRAGDEGGVFAHWWREPWRPVLASMLLGGLGFTDLWALPTFGTLAVGAAALGALRAQGPKGLWDALGIASALALGTLVLYAPFYAGLEGPVSGVAANQAWKAWAQRHPPLNSVVTRPVHFLIFWLPVLWLPIWWAGRAALRGGWGRLEGLLAVAPWALPLLAWAAFLVVTAGPGHFSPQPEGLLGEVRVRWENFNWLTLLILVAFLGVAGATLARSLRGQGGPQAFVALLVVEALLLLLGAELFYVRDPLGFRYNTVFRFWYHAWTMLAVVGSFAFQALLSAVPAAWWQRGARLAWAGATLALTGAALLYPLMVTLERTDAFRRPGGGLDGLAFLARYQPDEYAAVRWLNEHVRGSPVVLEAFGDDYSDFARISSRTGLPTILGWQGHELLWRPDPSPIAGRAQDIETIYTTTDMGQALALLGKYGVRYVVVGPLERQAYVDRAPPELRAQRERALDKFKEALQVVFRSGQVTVYRVPGPPRLTYP